jgi:hypothetical protein
MVIPIRIFHPSRSSNDYDALHLKAVRECLADCMRVLMNSPPANSFLGCKTQEPFPNEDDS